ncbi:MAG TPA: DNRLRE domain-containing protein [Patescibacteria group bacterium]
MALLLQGTNIATVLLTRPQSAYAATTVIQLSPTTGQDTWMNVSFGQSHENDTTIQAQNWQCTSGHEWVYVQFPLTSIPDGASINSATLSFNIESRESLEDTGIVSADDDTVQVSRVTTGWTEDVTFDSQPSIDSSSTYRTTTVTTASSGWLDLPVTKLVQDWKSETISNYGAMVEFKCDPDTIDKIGFTSSESASTSLRPKLTVVYNGGVTPTPTPSSTVTPTPTSTPTSNPTPTPSIAPTSTATPTAQPTATPQVSVSCLGITITEATTVDTATITFTTKKSVTASLVWDTQSHTSPPGKENTKATLSAYPQENKKTDAKGTSHSFGLGGLSPNTTYYYSLSFSDGTQDCENSLTTQPSPVVTTTSTPTSEATTTATTTPKPVKSGVPQASEIGSTSGSSARRSALSALTNGQAIATQTGTALIAGVTTVATLGLPAAQAITGLAQALGSLPQTLTSAWMNLLGLFGIRKKRMPWGRVLSSTTGEPIVGAMVSILNQDKYGQVVERAITDKEGRYGFFVEPGHFSLWAQRNGYTFPSQVLPKSYRGATFPIGAERMIILDLFCDPLEVTRPWVTTLKRIAMKAELLRLPLLVIGTALTISSLTVQVVPLTVILALLYVLFWINEFRHRRFGRHTIVVTDTHGQALAYTIVRLIDSKTNQIAFTKATDANGEIFVLVPAGTYRLQLMVRGAAQAIEQTVTLPKGVPLKQMKIEVETQNEWAAQVPTSTVSPLSGNPV